MQAHGSVTVTAAAAGTGHSWFVFKPRTSSYMLCFHREKDKCAFQCFWKLVSTRHMTNTRMVTASKLLRSRRSAAPLSSLNNKSLAVCDHDEGPSKHAPQVFMPTNLTPHKNHSSYGRESGLQLIQKTIFLTA